jgi:hypothetical protein
MRLAARLRSWPPTVTPIWASSPAAWTAVVTISGPRGGPLGCSVGGGVEAFGAAFAAAFAAGFGAAFAAAGFGFAFCAAAGFGLAAGFGAVAVAVAVDDFAALTRRSPPSRVGRVDRRVPSTLGSAAALVAFFVFFFADFWAMESATEREFPVFALRRDTVIGEAGAQRFDFKKYSA